MNAAENTRTMSHNEMFGSFSNIFTYTIQLKWDSTQPQAFSKTPNEQDSLYGLQ